MAKRKLTVLILLAIILVGVIFTSIFLKQQSFFIIDDDLSDFGTNYQEVRLEIIEGEKELYGTGEDFVQQQEGSYSCTKSNGDDREFEFNRYKKHKSLSYGFTVPTYDAENLKGMALVFEYTPSLYWNEEYPLTALTQELIEPSIGHFSNSELIFDIDSTCNKEISGKYRSEFGQCNGYNDFSDLIEQSIGCYYDGGERGIQTSIANHENSEYLSGQFKIDTLTSGEHTIDLARQLPNGQINLRSVYLRIYTSTDDSDDSDDSDDTDDTNNDNQDSIEDQIQTISEDSLFKSPFLWAGVAVLLIIISLLIFGGKKR